MDKALIRDISFIIRSKRRYLVLSELKNGLQIPTSLSKKLNMNKSSVSVILKDLVEKNMIQCVNFEAKRGRIYKITDYGNELLKLIEQFEIGIVRQPMIIPISMFQDDVRQSLLDGGKRILTNMTYWLGIINNDNFQKVIDKNIWGATERNKERFRQIHKGDILLFYVKSESIGGHRYGPVIAAIYKVRSEPYYDESVLFTPPITNEDELYPWRVKVKLVEMFDPPLQFQQFVKKLKIISNKNNWGIHLRGKTIIRLPLEDYETIIQIQESKKGHFFPIYTNINSIERFIYDTDQHLKSGSI